MMFKLRQSLSSKSCWAQSLLAQCQPLIKSWFGSLLRGRHRATVGNLFGGVGARAGVGGRTSGGWMDGRMDRQTDRQTRSDGLTDGQMDGRRKGETERKWEREGGG
jgi:hypothetical protein